MSHGQQWCPLGLGKQFPPFFNIEYYVILLADQITKTTAESIPATILSMEFFDRLTTAGKNPSSIVLCRFAKPLFLFLNCYELSIKQFKEENTIYNIITTVENCLHLSLVRSLHQLRALLFTALPVGNFWLF